MTDLPPPPDEPRPGGSGRVRSGSWDDDPRGFRGWADLPGPAPTRDEAPPPPPARWPGPAVDAEPARRATPAEVVLSCQLWVASIVLGVVSGLLGVLTVDRAALVDVLVTADTSGLTRSEAESAVTAGLVGGLVLAGVVLALEVLAVRRLRQGRHWARTVLTVLGVLSVLSSLLGLGAGLSLAGLANLVSLVLVATAVWLMHRPAASAFVARPAP